MDVFMDAGDCLQSIPSAERLIESIPNLDRGGKHTFVIAATVGNDTVNANAAPRVRSARVVAGFYGQPSKSSPLVEKV
jgi:hypothetical protein